MAYCKHTTVDELTDARSAILASVAEGFLSKADAAAVLSDAAEAKAKAESAAIEAATANGKADAAEKKSDAAKSDAASAKMIAEVAANDAATAKSDAAKAKVGAAEAKASAANAQNTAAAARQMVNQVLNAVKLTDMEGNFYVPKKEKPDGVTHYARQILTWDAEMEAWGATWDGDYVRDVSGGFKESEGETLTEGEA